MGDKKMSLAMQAASIPGVTLSGYRVPPPQEEKIMGEEVEELLARFRDYAATAEADAWEYPPASDYVAILKLVESLRASLTRAEEEREEALMLIEPFVKTPKDQRNPTLQHWFSAMDSVHEVLSRARGEQDKTDV